MTDTQATPRPWAMLQGFPDYIVVLVDRDKPLNWSKLPDYATPLCETHGPNNAANAALIVTAVNEYAALKAVEAAARTVGDKYDIYVVHLLADIVAKQPQSSPTKHAHAEHSEAVDEMVERLAALDAIRKPPS